MSYVKKKMIMKVRIIDMKVIDLIQAIVLCLISYTIGLYVGKSVIDDKGYEVVRDGVQVRDILTGVFYGSYIIGGLKVFDLA